MSQIKSFPKLSGALFFLLSICGLCSCSKNIGKNITVSPKAFKIQIPLIENKNGFVINTAWGTNKTTHLLNWDNHSPTWGDNTIIQNNPSVTKSKEYQYRTSTADGTSIHGDVYVCNEITFGNINFKNVPFYNIPKQINKKSANNTDGVFGEDLIAKGVWKFDFEKQIIIFASSMDSLDSVSEAFLIPSTFTDNTIQLEVKFTDRITRPVEIDFGYNGYIVLPSNDFKKIAEGNKRIYEDSLLFTTPASYQLIKSTEIFDSIMINKITFQTGISTNPLINEVLLGRKFFKHFEFVIFDYINKSIYLSKKEIQ